MASSGFKKFIGGTLVMKGSGEKFPITDLLEMPAGHGEIEWTAWSGAREIHLAIGMYIEAISMDDGSIVSEHFALVPPNAPPFVPWWRV